MQYQLEHHMFPTMPRYYYPAMVPILKQFAKEQGIQYKSCPMLSFYVQHYRTLKAAGQLPAVDE